MTIPELTRETIRLRRSALYTPSISSRMLQKGAASAADVLIVDLEDAIAPEFKAAARQIARESLPSLLKTTKEVVVRVNSLTTPWVDADLEAVCNLGIAAVLFPKVDTDAAIELAIAKLDGIEGAREVGVWCMIETPDAILNLRSLSISAQNSRGRVQAWVVGTNDLAKDLRLRQTASREHLLPYLSQTVVAARAANLCVLDGVHNAISDLVAYQAACEQGADMGFDGKTLIHPSQVELCNRVFAPSEAEIERAGRIVAAFEDPGNAGKGVIQIGGEMVELLHARAARRVLDVAAAIATSQRHSGQ